MFPYLSAFGTGGCGNFFGVDMKKLFYYMMVAGLLYSCRPVIDRESVVARHRIVTTETDPHSPAQVGNGRFAFCMDITGLQTFVPFNTLSQWGWHSFPQDEKARTQEYRGVGVAVGGREVPLEFPDDEQPEISAWLSGNPHRFNLGRLGLRLLKADGREAVESDLKDTRQEVDLWTGVVTSRFTLEGVPVTVETVCDPELDAIGVEVRSLLLEKGRLQFFMDFPYPDRKDISEYAGDYTCPGRHISRLESDGAMSACIRRQIDDTRYDVRLQWSDSMCIVAPVAGSHRFRLEPDSKGCFSLLCGYMSDAGQVVLSGMKEMKVRSTEAWRNYWLSGAAIDLSQSEDVRWKELERRIVLSQYLMRMNEVGLWPPQESGLVNNSWFGRFHFEMIWWHELHYLLWNRAELAEEAIDVYRKFLPTSRLRAEKQGYRGARWPKCTGDIDREWPHLIHATLIWQQPHPIYFAEEEYRLHPTQEMLDKWRGIVFATADYMSDYVRYDSISQRYVLGAPLCLVSENTPVFDTSNPAFELAYWRYGLQTAQTWRERCGLPREKQWEDVLEQLSPLPVEDGVYITYEGILDMWTRYNFEHPALAGIFGMLPGDGVDKEIFGATLDKILTSWQFDRVWGWDFPMLAMAAARCHRPEDAVDLLLYDSENFRFDAHGLATGGPFPYFPSNGGLLTAVAMMAGGWEGASGITPGFPKGWNVKTEGFRKMQ
ncbi:hypothetical protein [Bacteroides sp.]|uniref:hypothetical protein n=1 Tax=Bacteroides sp. TaxID=29523 RepID=UPI004024E5A1